ncbi:MAG TPA: hypothetical protein DCM28_08185 [Phycisphaerales bacterium]|nr:hypothetical protein [Phycisphaerales bacterium]HCD34932.1 hypothetical protein [Phycisphaerales bacterium]|tara:strand:- start:767 stop:1963 length:1197 start_codon:yes stop_codon:yes gene_type:complete
MNTDTLGTRLPVYQQLAIQIKKRIKQGEYPTGTRLPTLRGLCSEYGASLNAMQRALRELEGQRIIESRHGVGTWVTEQSECNNSALLFGFIQPFYSLFSTVVYHILESTLEDRANLCIMRTSRNDPAREKSIIDQLLANRINGILLWPTENDRNGDYLAKVAQQVPLVIVDDSVPGLDGPSVVLDYASLGRDIATWMHAHHAKRILYINDPLPISTYREHLENFENTIKQLGLQNGYEKIDLPLVDMDNQFNNSVEDAFVGAFAKLNKLIKRKRIDAIFCPQWSFMAEWLNQKDTPKQATDIHIHTLTSDTLSQRINRKLHQLGFLCWHGSATEMLNRGMDLLQEMAHTRKPLRMKVRIAFSSPKDVPHQPSSSIPAGIPGYGPSNFEHAPIKSTHHK